MAKTCKIKGCLSMVYARELCKLHYTRQQRGTDLSKEVEWLQQLLTKRCGLKRCHKPVFLHGFCFEHFHTILEEGLEAIMARRSVQAPQPSEGSNHPEGEAKRCQLKHCRRTPQDSGFCQDHADQLRALRSDKDLFDEAITDKTDSFEIRSLSLDQIDFDDTTYRIRQVIEPVFVEDLARSIRQVGLLHPPVVEPLPNGSYRLISGFCRTASLQLLARSQPEYRTFRARVIDPGGFSHLELLKIAFEENDKRNYVNHLEKALKATQLKHHHALKNEEIAEVMDTSERRVTELLSLVKQGHEEVLKALRDERITFYLAQELLKLESSEQPRWLDKVLENHWSIEQLKEALQEHRQEQWENDIDTMLDNGIEGIEFAGSSKQRGPYPVKVKLPDRPMLRKFYREFVQKYYV